MSCLLWGAWLSLLSLVGIASAAVTDKGLSWADRVRMVARVWTWMTLAIVGAGFVLLVVLSFWCIDCPICGRQPH